MNRGTLPPIVGSLTIAAGALSPIATALLIAVTLFCALPMYAQVLLSLSMLVKRGRRHHASRRPTGTPATSLEAKDHYPPVVAQRLPIPGANSLSHR
jgi:hypothetical protein